MIEQRKRQRKTGKAYRRMMTAKHKHDLMVLFENHYFPCTGWVTTIKKQVGTENQYEEKYIKYPNRSHLRGYWKQHANKYVRRQQEPLQGSMYRKCFDYWRYF